MDKFTVEEINLMCVFEGQDRTGMIVDITCYNSLSQIRASRDSLRLSFLETERRSV